MIEALACGTPVIARPCGSVPEVLADGVTGFVAASVDEMVAAVHKIEGLSRQRCRQEFETRFTAEVMVEKYEQVFRRLIEQRSGRYAHNANGSLASIDLR